MTWGLRLCTPRPFSRSETPLPPSRGGLGEDCVGGGAQWMLCRPLTDSSDTYPPGTPSGPGWGWGLPWVFRGLPWLHLPTARGGWTRTEALRRGPGSEQGLHVQRPWSPPPSPPLPDESGAVDRPHARPSWAAVRDVSGPLPRSVVTHVVLGSTVLSG